MPELPEVETVTRQLALVLPGKQIQSVTVLREKSFTGKTKTVQGKTIQRVFRKQKMVVMELSEHWVLLIHLKMTGQLIFLPTHSGKRVVGGHPTKDWVGTLPSKHTRVIVNFKDGSRLFFNDQRVFGWIKVVSLTEVTTMVSTMPPDVVDEAFTINYLTTLLKKSHRAVKLVILDQEKIGGMGNIYANDALYLSGVKPMRKACTLSKNEITRLYEAMKTVIVNGIETGGASYSHFVDTQGLGGHYQEQFLIYDKAGESCVHCGNVIKKITIGGRGSYFCPSCQR